MFKIFNTNVAVRISFVIALLSKFALLFNYRIVSGDKLLQAVGAYNILKGRGYTFSFVNANDFINIKYARIKEWPPLYSCLLSGIMKITAFDIEITCFIVDVISVIFFMSYFWLLIKKIGFPNIVQFFLLIYLAFFIKPYFTYSGPTDLLALAFLLAGLYYFLNYMEHQAKKDLLLLIVFMIADTYTRYMYIPVVFVFPLLLIWQGYRQKNNKYLLGGLLVFITCALAALPLLLQNYWVANTFNNQWVTGFYPENLMHISPIFWDMLIDTRLFSYQLSELTNTEYREVEKLWSNSNYLIMVALMVVFTKGFFVYLKTKTRNDVLENFFITGAILSFVIIIFLTYASISRDLDAERFGILGSWTYVEESRYFIFVHFYLLIGLTYLVFVRKVKLKGWKFIRISVLLLFTIETTHGLWLLAKSFVQRREDYTYVSYGEARKKLIQNLVIQTRAQNYDPVFFLHYSADYISYICMNEAKYCPDFEHFDKIKTPIQKPTRLIFIGPITSANSYYSSMLKSQGFSMVTTLGKVCVYSKYLLPGE